MQAKGFIKFIIGALFLLCLFYLSLTFFANRIEKKAVERGEQTYLLHTPETTDEYIEKAFVDSVKEQYLDSIKHEKVFLGMTYNKLQSKRLNLGLDLKGGMSMILEVDQANVLRKLANDTEDPAFNQAIENTIVAMGSSQKKFIDVFGEEYEEINPTGKLSAIFAVLSEYNGRLSWESTNEEVLEELGEDIDGSVGQTFNVLRTRIDEFGTSQADISLQENTGRIFVQIPGANNPERIRNIVERTALLEFYETHEMAEIFDKTIVKINEIVRNKLELQDTISTEVIDEAGGDDEFFEPIEDVVDLIDEAIDSVEVELDIFGEPITEATDDDSTDLTSESGELVEDEFNPLFEVFQPNLRSDEAGGLFYSEGSVVGYAAEENLAKVQSYFAYEEVQDLLYASGVKLLWDAKPIKDQETGEETGVYRLFAIKFDRATDEAVLTGEVITNAFQTYDQLGRPAVSLSMNAIGAQVWEEMTGANVGKSVAIVLDNKVFSAPVVQGKIAGGNTEISGLDDIEEAKDLANILKSGKLDAKVKIVEEAVVGSTLGELSKKRGIQALILGMIVVLLFMVAYYSSSGLVANLALLLNLVFIIGFLASRGAALTLPGMAGIVLTIGMAVDANVIIFERIREELRKDKSLKKAIADGFQHSYSAIIDANVTTLIAAVVLLIFGLGPVKGFAYVLAVGIVASLISAVLFSRLVFDLLTSKDKKVSFATGFSKNILSKVNFDFLSKRKIAYAISGIIIAAGIASIVTRGFDLGVDFKGGHNYVVRFDKDVTPEDLRATLTDAFETEPVVKNYDGTTKAQIITSYLMGSNVENADSIIITKLYNGLKPFYDNPPANESEFARNFIEVSNKVETTIADDIKQSALKAGLIGAVLIFLYLLFRFRKWQFGAGALAAVVHDILIILSIFSIFKGILPFSLEIEQKFIAALLTIIGYSINDTVVVFDRVREYLREHPLNSLKDNVNGAVSSTLSRTLMTSVTTFIVVAILFFLGGQAIRGFAFALMIGVIVGTYSSVFIATPIMFDTMKKKAEAITTKKKKK